MTQIGSAQGPGVMVRSPAGGKLFSPGTSLSTLSPESASYVVSMTGTTAAASAIWVTANTAVYVPFCLDSDFTAKLMWVSNGTVVSGNFDIGIYSESGTRLVSSGSTAQAGTVDIQTVDITDTPLAAGNCYWMALNFDNITATVLQIAPVYQLMFGMPIMKQAVGAVALPSTATMAQIASGDKIPVFGISGTTVI